MAARPERRGGGSASTDGSGEASKDHDRVTGTAEPIHPQSKGNRCVREVGKDSWDDHVWSCERAQFPSFVAIPLTNYPPGCGDGRLSDAKPFIHATH